MSSNLASLERNLTKAQILFIDLDDPLIYTSEANSSAYQKAIQETVGITLPYLGIRHTSTTIKEQLNLTADESTQISQLKQQFYPLFLTKTLANTALIRLISQAKKINIPIYLVTQCNKQRAEETLYFHNLSHLFTDKFYCKGQQNKYLYAISKLSINPKNILVFEDDGEEVNNALLAQIPKQNIFINLTD